MDEISYAKYLATPKCRKFPFDGLIGWLMGKSNTPAQPSLPESGVDPTTREITDSWEQIQIAINEGVHATRYQLGDTKAFTHETYGDVVMQIVAFDADDKADGTGKAAITWVSKDIIAMRSINDAYTETGWENSDIRTWLRGDFYTALPDDVKTAIVEVKKTYYYNWGSSCNDTVWLLSMREAFGYTDVESSGAEYTSFFSSDATRIKKYCGTTDGWWLRTPMVYDQYVHFAVNSNGGLGHTDVDRTVGVVFGFCM